MVDEQKAIHDEMLTTLSKELSFLRKAVKISQTELGKKIGVSRQCISSIERGETRMSWAIYISIIKFFNENLISDSEVIVKKHLSYVEKEMKL